MRSINLLIILCLLGSVASCALATTWVNLNGSSGIITIATHDDLTLTCDSAPNASVTIREYVDVNGNHLVDAGDAKEFQTTIQDNGPGDEDPAQGAIEYYLGPFDGGGDYVLEVSESGAGTAAKPMTVTAVTITGTVRDALNIPVWGAWVFLDGDYSTWFQTDSSGVYKAFVQPGTWYIGVSYKTTVAPTSPMTVTSGIYSGKDFKLLSSISYLTGTVTDLTTGAPIPAGSVDAVGTGSTTDHCDTLSNWDGTYRLALPPGTYDVSASAYGYALYEQSQSISPSHTYTVNFALTPQCSIAGRVVDIHGQPVVGVQVSALEALEEDTTDANGEYLLQQLAAGHYTVMVLGGYAGDYEDGQGVDLASGEQMTGVDFALTNVASVDGTLYASPGVPMPESAINAYRTSVTSTAPFSTTSNDWGEFHLLVDAGSYLVKATMGSTGAGRPLRVQAGDHVAGFDLYLSTQETLTSPTAFVKVGWNLLSIPGVPMDPDPVIILAGVDVANANMQYWNNWVADGGYLRYGDAWDWTRPMVPTIPYWFMESSATRQISFLGYPYTTMQTIAFPTTGELVR